MSLPRILVLGSSGMVGSMLVRVLIEEFGVEAVAATHRPGGRPSPETVTSVPYDALADDPSILMDRAGSPGWVVNAIGRTKPHIDETSATSRRVAIELNAVLPHRLAEAVERTSGRALMISTDAVFSGRGGPYLESSAPDPTDVYGASKRLGEVASQNVMHLRTSIIGPETGSHDSLLEWLLDQPADATVPGFVNHHWNGVTTLHLARLVAGIIRTEDFEPRVCHTVPADWVSKFELLGLCCEAFDRRLRITPERGQADVDRRLATDDATANARRWTAAGFAEVPTIRDMVVELASYARPAGLVPTSQTD